MGSLVLGDLIECVEDGLVGVRQALGWHLSVNCYPRVPAQMAEPIMTALLLVAAGREDHPVELPEGVSHRRYGSSVPAVTLVDSFHAWQFLDLVRGRVELTADLLGDGDD